MRRTLLLTGLGIALCALFPSIASASEGEEFAARLGERGFLLTYLSCFGFGLAASLTPCVYPMIPIVVGVFGARDEAVTRRRAFALATAYVLGMGLVYAVLGVVFALLGKAGDQGQILANPYIVVPLVALYAVLAASMFGAFEINLPSGVQQRLARVGGKGYGGAFAMGMVGGFTAAPCTGPFLAGLLGWVATTGRPVVGGTMLFTFALGMGVLFWIIAATSVSLPKSGRWMEWVKSIGGIALVVVGIYFLRPIIPQLAELGSPSIIFLAGAVGLTVLGLILGAVHLSFHGRRAERTRKAVAVLLTVVGVTGAMNSLLTPDRRLPWMHDEAAAFAEAKASGKGVLIDFSATYCKPCGKLETDTFAADGVFERIMDGYVPLKFDVSKGTDADDQHQEKYGAETLPAVILLDAGGRELGRVREFVPADEFMDLLRAAESKRGLGSGKTAAR
jgi:thiol:disulfide interchange protein DsbD